MLRPLPFCRSINFRQCRCRSDAGLCHHLVLQMPSELTQTSSLPRPARMAIRGRLRLSRDPPIEPEDLAPPQFLRLSVTPVCSLSLGRGNGDITESFDVLPTSGRGNPETGHSEASPTSPPVGSTHAQSRSRHGVQLSPLAQLANIGGVPFPCPPNCNEPLAYRRRRWRSASNSSAGS